MKKISSYNKALKDAKKKIIELCNGTKIISHQDLLDAIDSCKRPEITSSLEDGPGTPPTDPKGGGTR